MAWSICPATAHDDYIGIIAKSKPSVFIIQVNNNKSFFKTADERRREKALGKYAEFYSDSFDSKPSKKIGTGFVVQSNSAFSWMLTAAHVVKKSSKIRVKLKNGNMCKAQLSYMDAMSDVALLKVACGDLPVLKLNSSRILEGQSVVGLGAAFGFPVSSSLGIISAVGVNLKRKGATGLLQTDVTVNPGSSGGPLIGVDGGVVGLITKIFTSTGTFSGMSFAVPADELNVLLQKWLVDRPLK